MLSGELATRPTGRYVDFTLFPFSFKELIRYREVAIPKEFAATKTAEVRRFLQEYLEYGGFPETHRFGREILVRIYSDIVQKDILRRFGIKKKNTLKEFVKYLISNLAREFSYRKIANVLEVKDVHTVKNWFDAIENSYLGFALERYSPKIKQQIIAPKNFMPLIMVWPHPWPSESPRIPKDSWKTWLLWNC